MYKPDSLANQAQITLHMGGEKLYGWKGLTVERSIDSGADAFSFALPWDPTPENIKRFRPFAYQIPKIYVAETLILTGYVELLIFATSEAGRTLNIQGRSASGMMIDAHAGPPFQFEGVMFNTLATKLYQVLDPKATVGAAFATPDFGPIAEVVIEPGQTIYDVLSKLAHGKSLWGRATASGRLEFTRFSSAAASIGSLVEGESPLRSASVVHDGTKRFQRYMVVGTSEGDTSEAEVNDYETIGLAKRGRKIQKLSQQSTDLTAAAKFARSRAMLDSYVATAEVDGWHYNGHLWTPGEIITVQAPGAYLFEATRLVVMKATMKIDEAGGQSTTLDLGLPAIFDGSEPKTLPYDEAAMARWVKSRELTR